MRPYFCSIFLSPNSETKANTTVLYQTSVQYNTQTMFYLYLPPSLSLYTSTYISQHPPTFSIDVSLYLSLSFFSFSPFFLSPLSFSFFFSHSPCNDLVLSIFILHFSLFHWQVCLYFRYKSLSIFISFVLSTSYII